MKKLTVNLKDIGDVEVNVPEGCTIKLDGSHICVVKEEKEVLTWDEIIDNMPNSSMMWHTLGNGNIARDYINDIDRLYYRNWVNTQRQAEKLNAIAQLMVIADYYNDGWEPRDMEVIYIPAYVSLRDYGIRNVDGYDVVPITIKGNHYGVPCFRSFELAEKAIKNNKEIFETALKP